MLTLLILAGAALLAAVALVSGNNLSACVGTVIGAGILRRRTGIILGVAGYISGLILQGHYLADAATKLLPVTSSTIITEALLVTVIVFMIGHVLKAPLSLTMSLVGLITGISVANHQAIDVHYFDRIAIMWIAAPLIAICSAYVATKLLNRSTPRNVWHRVSVYKILLIVVSFLAAYVLGANTVALMVSVAGFNTTNIFIATIGIIAGCFLLSSRELKRVGHELFSLRYSNALVTLANSVVLVEIATLFGLPLSNTQTLSAGLFGSGLSYRQRCISMKPFAIIVVGWVLAPLASFIVGYFI
ncbi:MAG: inorganic phosphate transporter [Thermoplasmata archaeon]|uniref:Inorganic phosphate transporter n=1 Tax=Candidatus Sysuiplasma superficiale TaxID=2823368 RepID=A0A8J8CD58_9ARCH|nr:inorganic phosphate transporter [Candidatus Sysuiplasma superficiale]MBX8643287.1 inorganic phosphate transporter [Candidatus Sysuiplasma superficiale]